MHQYISTAAYCCPVGRVSLVMYCAARSFKAYTTYCCVPSYVYLSLSQVLEASYVYLKPLIRGGLNLALANFLLNDYISVNIHTCIHTYIHTPNYIHT